MINIAYLTFLAFCIVYSSGEVAKQREVFIVPRLEEVLKQDQLPRTEELLKQDEEPRPEEVTKGEEQPRPEDLTKQDDPQKSDEMTQQDDVPSQEELALPASKDGASRVLTEIGYLRYGDPFYIYPSPSDKSLFLVKNPTDTNKLEDPVEENKRPLFYFTTYETPLNSYEQFNTNSGPYIEIRKKRDLEGDIPESSKIGKLRRKRTYCNRCGGGYGGGYSYIPVTIAVYPVYSYPVYYKGGGGGGRKRGCNRCGWGGGGGGGGGFSGSYSYSSSSSHSSSGSWNYGK